MRKHWFSIALAIILVITLGWGIYQYKEKNDYHTYLDMHFQRQFYELIGHVENAQINLSKAMISASSKSFPLIVHWGGQAPPCISVPAYLP